MAQIARYGKATANEGRGGELATGLLAAAEELRSDPGCELYLVNREAGKPDVLWVTELWRSQEDLDAAREKVRDSDAAGEALELTAEWEMVELELLGGKGARPAGEGDSAPFTRVNIDELEDLAAKHGLSDFQEARFPNRALGTEQTGLGHLRLKPGVRMPFAHRHNRAEEVYLVVSGSGRAKLGDEIVELAERDAIRVSPETVRAFEAGEEGLELIAFSALHPGDAEMVRDWWQD
jgi:mannose-6-phosphate isomerase-like protein (cupin superfamily)/quinol monooxygenase YgiN